ncbi:MAG: hypothetical protein ACLQGP_21065 [Isosphaeraceae bacterium]
MKSARPPSPCGDPQHPDPPARSRRGPKRWSPDGLERIRASTLATRPWELACGPRTAEGKARSARNGRARQKGEKSARELRAEIAGVFSFIGEMAAARRSLM